ncbi:MAG: NAD(+)/NADH kinase [Rikenellaceae bacterium]
MKIAIYSRAQAIHNVSDLENLFEILKKHCIKTYYNDDFAELIDKLTNVYIAPEYRYSSHEQLDNKIDIVISYGGDGTFLECVRMVYGCDTPIVGINSGRLGFLATVNKNEIETLLCDIKNKKYTLEQRTMLRIESDDIKNLEYPFAFNEFTVQREGAEMVKADVSVDGEFVATYWGDGVILSTPSGSTAYALSVGGPIIPPQNNCMALLPIASHNLTMRPIIFPDSSTVSFEVDSRDSHQYISLDNRKFNLPGKATIKVTKAKKSIFLLKPQNISFYNTLRKKMMWGFDGREVADDKNC